MTPRARSLAVGTALTAALLAGWWGCDLARRQLIRAFFVDAPPGPGPTWAVGEGPGVAPAARVRVALLDGLSAAHAARLPRLGELCAGGRQLRIDVGFPTVSLPVQHALWTGRTQQQSGVLYHIGKLERPPAHAIPPQVDSVAVAETHPEIVHSFGFGRAEPAIPADKQPLPPTWQAGEFAAAARAAVAAPTRLVFVHVLRVDEAGHAEGAASPAYAAAAAWADDLLAALVAAAPPDPATLWLVLSDHGHRPAGGHGGSEPELRVVHGCLVGGGVAPGEARPVHLVDVARALADALGATLAPDARGRPLAVALAEPRPDATLPHPGLVRRLVAAVLAFLGLLSLQTGPRGQAGDLARAWLLGLTWPLLAWLGLVAFCGWPSLSNPAIYPPQGRDMVLAATPGLLALALLYVATARRGWSAAAVVRAALAPWLALTAAALVLCHAPEALLYGVPPLMPGASAAMSVLLVHGKAACLLLGLAVGLHTLLGLRGAARGT